MNMWSFFFCPLSAGPPCRRDCTTQPLCPQALQRCAVGHALACVGVLESFCQEGKGCTHARPWATSSGEAAANSRTVGLDASSPVHNDRVLRVLARREEHKKGERMARLAVHMLVMYIRKNSESAPAAHFRHSHTPRDTLIDTGGGSRCQAVMVRRALVKLP